MIKEKLPKKIKIVLMGTSRCGKSSLLEAIVKEKYPDFQEKSMIVKYKEKIFEVKNNLIWFQFWDIPGQQEYLKLVHRYLCKANIALIMFSQADRFSLDQLGFFLQFY